MVIRPLDNEGDILPVFTHRDLAKSSIAAAMLADCRLKFLIGDWWENLSWGNAIINMLKKNRYTESDQRILANYLTSYIKNMDEVIDVSSVNTSVEGRGFSYSCTVEMDSGSFEISYSI